MIMHHQIFVVLAGAAAHFITGWVLNSEMLLGTILKTNKPKAPKADKDFHIKMAAQFAASTVLAVATYVVICMIEKSVSPAVAQDTLSKIVTIFSKSASPEKIVAPKNLLSSLHAVTFIWAGFILPSSIDEVIWCGHDLKKWMIEMGMHLAGLFAIAATIIYLA